MKLLYHSLGAVETGYGKNRTSGYVDSLETYFEKVGRDTTTIELRGTSNGGIADSYRYFAGLDTFDVLKTIIGTRDEDVDGIILGNIFDPGLREGRELLSIPIVGQLEASVSLAQLVADGYGIVSINEKQAAHSLDKLRMYEATSRLTSIEGMKTDISAISDAYGDASIRGRVLEEFERVSTNCIADGAEVLVPGGGILSMLLVEHGVTEIDGVPVIDQVAGTVKLAELLVDLYEMGAIRTSDVGTFRAPAPSLIDELNELYFSSDSS